VPTFGAILVVVPALLALGRKPAAAAGASMAA
jgi:uncharacterized membrane protein YfcA